MSKSGELALEKQQEAVEKGHYEHDMEPDLVEYGKEQMQTKEFMEEMDKLSAKMREDIE